MPGAVRSWPDHRSEATEVTAGGEHPRRLERDGECRHVWEWFRGRREAPAAARPVALRDPRAGPGRDRVGGARSSTSAARRRVRWWPACSSTAAWSSRSTVSWTPSGATTTGEGAEIALRSTISRLRKRLRDAGAPDDLIVTRAPGYVLDVPAEVDRRRSGFERLVAEGRRQLDRRRPSECTRLLTEAEDLWRGPAYSEVRDEPFARSEARRLEELLLTATETRMDAGLTLGRHEALVGELESLTSANPMRERLWTQRMLALYRSGRQAEALRVFQDLRLDPGGRARDRAGARRDVDGSAPSSPRTRASTSRSRPSVPAPATTTEMAAKGRAAPRRPPPQRLPCPDAELAVRGPIRRSRPGGGGVEGVVDVGAGRRRRACCWSTATPGIGKTRLVAELARSVEAEGAVVLWGRCDEDPGGAVPSPSPRRSAATSSPSPPTGSRACPTGSSTSSPGWCRAYVSTHRPWKTRRAIPRPSGSASSRR